MMKSVLQEGHHCNVSTSRVESHKVVFAKATVLARAVVSGPC